MNSFYQLMLANFRVFFREPAILFWAVGFPIIIAGVLGLAFSKKQGSIRKIGIVEEKSIIIKKLENKKPPEDSFTDFKYVSYKTKEEAILDMKRGKILLFITEELGELKYNFDPGNSESHISYLILKRMEKDKSSSKSSINQLSSAGERYIDFLIPGLIAMGVMNSCLWGTGWYLIDFRIKKLMRRIVATPMSKTVFMVTQFFTRVILGGVEFVILILFSRYAFGVKIQGDISGLLLIYLAGNIAFLGIAIVVSSRAANMQVGNGLINSVTFPMTILSGVFFSYHNFPDWLSGWIKYLPLTMLADSMRAIFIEGATFSMSLFPASLLSVIGFITLLIGLRIYKWY